MLRLIYRQNSHFLIRADTVEDLITLARRGFCICFNANTYTEREEYVRLSEAEVRRQWDELTALNTSATATHEAEHRVWTARYLRTKSGLYKDQDVQAAIAAVIDPRENFHSSHRVSWYLDIGLTWTHGGLSKPLTAAAERLIAIVANNEVRPRCKVCGTTDHHVDEHGNIVENPPRA
jgi:hypothetical protein